jgi:hypothetical protein
MAGLYQIFVRYFTNCGNLLGKQYGSEAVRKWRPPQAGHHWPRAGRRVQGGNSGEAARVGRRPTVFDPQRPDRAAPSESVGAVEGWERSPTPQRRGHATMINQNSIYPLTILVQW